VYRSVGEPHSDVAGVQPTALTNRLFATHTAATIALHHIELSREWKDTASSSLRVGFVFVIALKHVGAAHPNYTPNHTTPHHTTTEHSM
jgi:hypothetical protein